MLGQPINWNRKLSQQLWTQHDSWTHHPRITHIQRARASPSDQSGRKEVGEAQQQEGTAFWVRVQIWLKWHPQRISILKYDPLIYGAFTNRIEEGSCLSRLNLWSDHCERLLCRWWDPPAFWHPLSIWRGVRGSQHAVWASDGLSKIQWDRKTGLLEGKINDDIFGWSKVCLDPWNQLPEDGQHWWKTTASVQEDFNNSQED